MFPISLNGSEDSSTKSQEISTLPEQTSFYFTICSAQHCQKFVEKTMVYREETDMVEIPLLSYK